MPGLKDKIIPTDRAIIEQIEKQILVKLKPRSLDSIFYGKGYTLDKKGQVKELNLDNGKIKDLSFFIGLSGLTHLSLRSNQITDLTPLKELKNLWDLDVKDNRIEKLPPEILTWWPKLEIHCNYYYIGGLNLYGNPLTDPPVEIVEKGKAAIQNYFTEIAEASVFFMESKLLIVGNGDVGKTTLMKKLKDPKFKVVPGKEDTTRGIDIQPWHLSCPFPDCLTRDVKIHFWDFGGQ